MGGMRFIVIEELTHRLNAGKRTQNVIYTASDYLWHAAVTEF